MGTGCLETLRTVWLNCLVSISIPVGFIYLFMVYLTTFSVAQLTECRMIAQLVNNGLKQRGNKVVP
jgi:hypothetical protein